MIAQQAQGRSGGKIIIIGSVLAEVPFISSAPYNMAKAAINHLGRTLAAELAEYHINVNVINPGWIDTPGEHKLATEDQIKAGAKRIPWGRLGLPRDIGRAAAYLASQRRRRLCHRYRPPGRWRVSTGVARLVKRNA
jgi:glucose 1-dehydrogenase